MVINLRKEFLKNKKLEHDLKYQFREIFGANLHDFMDPYTGFDIVKFDDFMKTPDDTSLYDWLKSNNTLGFEIVKKLIGYKEVEDEKNKA